MIAIVAGVLMCIGLVVVLAVVLGDDETPAPLPFEETSQNSPAAAEAQQAPEPPAPDNTPENTAKPPETEAEANNAPADAADANAQNPANKKSD